MALDFITILYNNSTFILDLKNDYFGYSTVLFFTRYIISIAILLASQIPNIVNSPKG